jgi:hypothetical protein
MLLRKTTEAAQGFCQRDEIVQSKLIGIYGIDTGFGRFTDHADNENIDTNRKKYTCFILQIFTQN